MKIYNKILIYWLRHIYLLIIAILLITQIDYEKVNWIGYVFIFEYLGRCIYFTIKTVKQKT